MTKKYLPLYYEFIESGKMSHNGLCSVIKYRLGYAEKRQFRLLFEPTLKEERYWRTRLGFWLQDDIEEVGGFNTFTPTRQNALLLMAAINGEL